jgi:hypothetical protein
MRPFDSSSTFFAHGAMNLDGMGAGPGRNWWTRSVICCAVARDDVVARAAAATKIAQERMSMDIVPSEVSRLTPSPADIDFFWLVAVAY